jgi:hypothetical protein
MLAQLIQSGLSAEAAQANVRERIDAAAHGGSVTVTAAYLATRENGLAIGGDELAAWLATPLPEGHMRAVVVNGKGIVPYSVSVNWTLPTTRNPTWN